MLHTSPMCLRLARESSVSLQEGAGGPGVVITPYIELSAVKGPVGKTPGPLDLGTIRPLFIGDFREEFGVPDGGRRSR